MAPFFSRLYVLLLILFITLPLSHHAQHHYAFSGEADESLVPYLKGKLYGFADQQGRVVITPDYEEVIPFNLDGYAQAYRLGLWGVLDKEGNAKVDFFLKHKSAALPMYNYDGEDNPLAPDCYMLKDDASRRWALFLPTEDYLATTWYSNEKLPGKNQMKKRYNENWDMGYFIYGYKQVVDADGMANFIDTKGQLVLPEPILNGSPLGEGLFSFLDENGLVGIMDHFGKTVIAPQYSSIQRLGKARAFEVFGEGNRYCALMDWNGKLLTDTIYKSINPLGEQYVKASKGAYYGVLDIQGNTVFPPKYANIRTFKEMGFLVKEGTLQYLIDAEGNYLMEEGYEKLSTINDSPYLRGTRGDSIFVLDEQLKEKATFIGFNHSITYTLDGVFILSKNRQFYLYDVDGNPILDEGYRKIGVAGFDKLYTVIIDKKAGLFSLDKGWIHPLSTYNSTAILKDQDGPGKHHIRFQNQTEDILYKGSLEQAERKKKRESDIGYSVLTENGQNRAILSDGREVTYPEGYELQLHYNKSHIWFTQKSGQGYLLYNTRMKPVLPEGYFLRRKEREEGNQLPLFIAQKDREFGLISLEGEWIIEPLEMQGIRKVG